MTSNIHKRWMFPTLPSAPHIFHPSYSIFRSENGQYNCILCGHDSMGRLFTRQDMEKHCNDPTHCALVKDLLYARDATKVEMFRCLFRHDAMYPRIEQLRLPAWQDKVRSDLCLYLGSVGNNTAAFTRAVNNLFKYEHMERISLLELAAWKAACVLDMEESKMIHDMLEWVNHGWMKNKTKMRRSTATTVIVENVLRFLEGPRRITTDQESLAMFTPPV